MEVPTVLQFAFNCQPIRFPVGKGESFTSPFTGRDLRRLKTEVTVAPDEADLVKAFVATSPVTDSDGAIWSGNIEMESYTNDGPHSFTITWSESEELRADVVEFEGLVLTPTRYEERPNDDGSIVIAFQAVLSKEETDRLRSLVPDKRSDVLYFFVVRRGVSDEARSVRLGRVLWQQLDDGTICHDITLVDEAFDSSDEGNAFLGLAGEPMVGNLVRQVSSLLVQFETLLAELEAAGVVAPEALERVRSSAEALAPARRYVFCEVSDLSKW